MKYVTETGLTNTLNNFIQKLKIWLPFKWNKSTVNTLDLTENNDGEVAFGKYNISTDDSILTVGIGDEDDRRNALEIQKDGDIFILVDSDNDGVVDERVNLQNMISTGGSADSLTEEEINSIINK